jgi:hypothetical protein
MVNKCNANGKPQILHKQPQSEALQYLVLTRNRAISVVAMCETCKEFPKMCNTSGVKQHELCIITRIQQILDRDMTDVNIETI